MAKQRINPEVQTDRVFQPTAQPVDLYYRPNLSAVELSRTGQIIDALKAFSPQLERFTSDIVAMNIATEKRVGAMEAMSGTVEAASAKAAKAIEGAGGVNPWRYEAFLDTMGRRMVREKYQAALYQNIDDLSALTNPDGTLRSGDYVTQKMTEFFTDVGVPQGSYFAARAAMDEKTKIDAQFMPMVQARHAEKLKAQNMQDLKDEMFGILGRQSTLHLADDGREIRDIMEKFRQLTGTSGAEVFTDSLIEFAQSEANTGDFESALGALRAFEKDGKYVVEGIELGASFSSKINAAVDNIEAKKLQDDTELRRNRLLAYQDALNSGMSMVTQAAHDAAQAAEGKGEIAAISMTQDQMSVAVDAMVETLKKTNRFPEDMEGQMRAALMDQYHSVINSTNRPVTNNPNSIKLLSDMADQGLPADVYRNQVWDMVRNREISYETALGYLAQYDSKDAMLKVAPAVKGMAVNLVDYGIDDVNSLTPSERANMLALVQADQTRIDTLANGVWRSEIMQLPEAERGPAMAQKYADIRGKVLAESVAANKERIQKADSRRMVTTALEDKNIKKLVESSTEFIGSAIGIDGASPSDRLEVTTELTGMINAEFSKEYSRLLDEGTDPDRALQVLGNSANSIALRVLKEVQNPNNPNVHIKIRSLASAASQLDLGGVQPTAEQAAAGMVPQTGLEGLVNELEQLRQVVPGMPYGLGWTQQNLVPSLRALDNQVRFAKDRYMAGEPDAIEYAEGAKRSAAGLVSYTLDNFTKIQTRQSPFSDKPVSLYTIRNGAVSAWSMFSERYEPSPEMTASFMKLKTAQGMDLSELRSKVTKEGVRINFAQLDPNRDLIIKSNEDMIELIKEYDESGGKSGILVDWIQAIPGDKPSPEALLDSQHRLFRQRIPTLGAPAKTPAPTSISGFFASP